MTKNKAAKARKQAYATAKKASIKAAVTDRYLTVKEAAEWLKMSESHIYFLKHKRKIPYVKLGGKLLFGKDDLKKWVESNSSAPTPFVRYRGEKVKGFISKAKEIRKPGEKWKDAVKRAALESKKEQYYDIGTNQLVDAPSKEVTYEGAKRFLDTLNKETQLGTHSKPMTKKEVVEMATPNLNTVLELGHLQIQILRTGKEVSIIPDMNGDPIDISAGICSLMMKNPAYRKVFETGVYMYQSFKKP